jgi:hypothetical protein
VGHLRKTQYQVVNQVTVLPEKAVVLVGAALDGPTNIPFLLNDNEEPHKVLGQSPLADAIVAARAVGVNDIIAYRINGVHATATLMDNTGRAVVEFRSVSASDKYNAIQLMVYPTHLYIINTDGVSRSYFFDKYKTVNELAYAINRDAFYGLVEFTAHALDGYFPLVNIVSGLTELLFKGGATEEHLINTRDPLGETTTDSSFVTSLLKERIKVALFGEDPLDIADRSPNSELGSLHFGTITLCDIYHDDDAELTEMLGSFCMNKTAETGFGSIGVIGTKPIFPEVLSIDELGENIETEDMEEAIRLRVLELIALAESLEDKEAYKYVQVIVGHTKYGQSTRSSVPVSYGYAAAQALNDIHISMSNKSINGFGKLNFEISKEDIALLTANGYTCIVPSIRRGFVPFYATSFSKDKESLMSKPHNLRISQYVSRMLTEEVDYLIGSTYNALSIQETMEIAKGLLDGMVADKVIRSYGLRHELLESNTVLNIYASLTPFSEVRTVNSMAVISFPRGVIA